MEDLPTTVHQAAALRVRWKQRVDRTQCEHLIKREVPACKGGGIYSQRAFSDISGHPMEHKATYQSWLLLVSACPLSSGHSGPSTGGQGRADRLVV
jgi:hypothetical protein